MTDKLIKPILSIRDGAHDANTISRGFRQIWPGGQRNTHPQKQRGRFYFATSAEYLRFGSFVSVFKKISDCLNMRDYAGAAIRFSHMELDYTNFLRDKSLHKANFDPEQPRNPHGEWTKVGDIDVRPTRPVPPDGQRAVVDPYCKIVKELCIVEATDALPTKDDGFSFFNLMNSCMDRHGCLGRA